MANSSSVLQSSALDIETSIESVLAPGNKSIRHGQSDAVAMDELLVADFSQYSGDYKAPCHLNTNKDSLKIGNAGSCLGGLLPRFQQDNHRCSIMPPSKFFEFGCGLSNRSTTVKQLIVYSCGETKHKAFVPETTKYCVLRSDTKELASPEELRLPYETHWAEQESLKGKPYEIINPNDCCLPDSVSST